MLNPCAADCKPRPGIIHPLLPREKCKLGIKWKHRKPSLRKKTENTGNKLQNSQSEMGLTFQVKGPSSELTLCFHFWFPASTAFHSQLLNFVITKLHGYPHIVNVRSLNLHLSRFLYTELFIPQTCKCIFPNVQGSLNTEFTNWGTSGLLECMSNQTGTFEAPNWPS